MIYVRYDAPSRVFIYIIRFSIHEGFLNEGAAPSHPYMRNNVSSFKILSTHQTSFLDTDWGLMSDLTARPWPGRNYLFANLCLFLPFTSSYKYWESNLTHGSVRSGRSHETEKLSWFDLLSFQFKNEKFYGYFLCCVYVNLHNIMADVVYVK